MAVTREQKKKILEKLQGITEKNSVVFLNFHKVGSGDTVAIRKQLRGSGVSYYVAKKTLIKKAFEASKISGTFPELDGEIALVYGDDPTAAAREIYAFQKSLKNAVSIVGGIFEQKYLSKSEMEEIAQIPGLDTLRGMFVNVINSPIQGFVLSLKAIADKRAA